MPVDDKDEREGITENQDAPRDVEEVTDGDGVAAHEPARKRRRYLTRRNALLSAAAVSALVLLLILAGVFFYRSGRVDSILANQIKATLDEYNIRAEVEGVQAQIGARTVIIRNLALFDKTTGARLGNVRELRATVRVEDMFALSLRRNVNLESLAINGLDLDVVFDGEGRSNFSNITLPEADPNRRILFSYSTAKINITDSRVRYADERFDLAGEARNVGLQIEPEDLSQPEDARMNRIFLTLTDSTLSYDGRPVEPIDITARARANQTRAVIDELIVRSPVTEARAHGVIDDLRALRYRLNVESKVDLQQVEAVAQTGAALRGFGDFKGVVTGEGTRYQVDGGIESERLVAANVRLQGFNLQAFAQGDGAAYEAQGRAVAEVLNAGDFRLDALQLAGQVRGTGADFRWLGELRAAAARSGSNGIAGLIVRDAIAEKRDEQLAITARQISGANLTASGTRINEVNLADVRVTADDIASDNLSAKFSVGNVRTGTIATNGARVGGITANGVTGTRTGATTFVQIARANVGGVEAGGARLGSLNVAGVRLSVRDGGRVEGSAADTNVGTVAFKAGGQSGNARDVRVRRPVFVLEPSGGYRASADLSLGGGVLGNIELGAASSQVTATNNEITLRDFNANLANGNARGNAVIATSNRTSSNINSNFTNLDIGKLLALAGGSVVPVRGATSGTVNLSFPGTNFELASGRVEANINGETGEGENARTPITGNVAINANRGNFAVERANLNAGATALNATGAFSLRGDSNLNLDLQSGDAGELARIIAATGLVPDVQATLDNYNIAPGGNLSFKGNVRGRIDNPTVEGQVNLTSILAGGRNIGSLAAQIVANANQVTVSNGRLTQPQGGGVEFAASVPLKETNNISLQATIDRLDARNVAAFLPQDVRAKLGDVRSEINGKIDVAGLPVNARGTADLRFGQGAIAGQAFDEITARANFNGADVTLETVDARLPAGRLTADGRLTLAPELFSGSPILTRDFNFNLRGENINLALLQNLTGQTGSSAPQLAGNVNVTARASGGNLLDFASYNVNFDARGQNVAINNRSAGELALTGRTENGVLRAQLTTGIFGQPQIVNATISLNNDELPTTIETAFNNTDLTPLFAALLNRDDVRVTGRANGTIRLNGNLYTDDEINGQQFNPLALRGEARFDNLAIAVNDVQLAADAPLLVQFNGNEIVFERTRFIGQGTNIVLGGTYALTDAGRQNLSVDGDVNLRILNGFSPNVFLAGMTKANVRVTGTAATPRITGSAVLTNAGVSALVGSNRLVASNVNGTLRFTSNQAQVDNLTGRLGGGRFSITGGALLEGFTPTQFRFALRGDEVSLPLPQNIRATADADLVLQGTNTAQGLSGLINLRRAEYTEDIDLADFINQRREASLAQGGEGDDTESGLLSNLALDLRVQGRDAIVIRNNLADARGSAVLQIRGTANDPVISGRIALNQGTITFRNDRYELTRAFIDLPAQRNADPIINVNAETEIRGYRVIVSLAGELSNPQATLRSDPALPQADVVALVTTGDLAGENTTLAGAGLGTATSLLTDQIINAPLQRATDRLFGLNRFEINPGANLGGRNGATLQPRLTVGRRVNRNLSFTYSTNLTAQQNQIVAVEYRVSDRLSFVANYEQGSTQSFNTTNNDFNFEIRFRKRF